MSDADRRIPLTILVAAQVGAMALWFSASAVVPAMSAEVALSDTREALFTSLVQLGFVVGTLISAALTLPDRIDPRRLFLIASLIGAAANAGVVWVGPAADAALVMRFVTGACMAGIYPVGMKMASTWARGDMGLVVGLLVGALTLG
jgi:MFS family permease